MIPPSVQCIFIYTPPSNETHLEYSRKETEKILKHFNVQERKFIFTLLYFYINIFGLIQEIFFHGKNMIDLNYLDGKTLALILWGNNKEGKSDIRICMGTIRKQGVDLFFDCKPRSPGFFLEGYLVAQIKLPDDSLKQVMKGAQFILSLSVGTLHDGNLEDLVYQQKKRA